MRGVQMALPGMTPAPTRTESAKVDPETEHWDRVDANLAVRSEYDATYKTGSGTLGMERVPNPIFSKDTDRIETSMQALDYDNPSEPNLREEWLPTEGLTSEQPTVRSGSVQHLIDNNFDGLSPDTPNPSAIAHEDEAFIIDGNHRTNAMLAQGRLFFPANVKRRGGQAPHLGYTGGKTSF